MCIDHLTAITRLFISTSFEVLLALPYDHHTASSFIASHMACTPTKPSTQEEVYRHSTRAVVHEQAALLSCPPLYSWVSLRHHSFVAVSIFRRFPGVTDALPMLQRRCHLRHVCPACPVSLERSWGAGCLGATSAHSSQRSQRQSQVTHPHTVRHKAGQQLGPRAPTASSLSQDSGLQRKAHSRRFRLQTRQLQQVLVRWDQKRP
mmetsp:Transcript_12964/g.18123  ORF Transcript_12964/g.18123 Transcript_12964/m.18123 type:complete len:205 (-) Transcript_12964:1212-1826(-)